MADDILSREQRLRKEAELQSLYTSLSNLRDRESSYINNSAPIPQLFLNQIEEMREKINRVEGEILTLEGEQAERPSSQSLYQQAVEAELSGNTSAAIKLYKKAGRHKHPDAHAAGRSIRYRLKQAKQKSASTPTWIPNSSNRPIGRILLGLIVLLFIALAIALFLRFRLPSLSQDTADIIPTATPSPTFASILTSPSNSTSTSTMTRIPTPSGTPLPPSPTPTATSTSTPTDTSTPTPTPTLRPPPQIIGPKNGLVWGDGTIVFEFADFKLAHDELYCINILRGYDDTLTENWSYNSIGRKTPYVPLEANPFHVAKAQGIECVVWSAFIGQSTCDNPISQNTEERIIGLPHPCDFRQK